MGRINIDLQQDNNVTVEFLYNYIKEKIKSLKEIEEYFEIVLENTRYEGVSWSSSAIQDF